MIVLRAVCVIVIVPSPGHDTIQKTRNSERLEEMTSENENEMEEGGMGLFCRGRLLTYCHEALKAPCVRVSGIPP